MRSTSALHQEPRRHVRHHQRLLSDFSPLVSKLRENAKKVIGIGVKKSTSDLFISNCDEFIYYDDLVRVEQVKRRPSAAPNARSAKPATEKNHGAGPSIDGALDLPGENPGGPTGRAG